MDFLNEGTEGRMAGSVMGGLGVSVEIGRDKSQDGEVDATGEE